MEYTLRDVIESLIKDGAKSLNPCFNGIYSQSTYKEGESKVIFVLILVLMEYTLRANPWSEKEDVAAVLILVLMEYTLRGLRKRM